MNIVQHHASAHVLYQTLAINTPVVDDRKGDGSWSVFKSRMLYGSEKKTGRVFTRRIH